MLPCQGYRTSQEAIIYECAEIMQFGKKKVEETPLSLHPGISPEVKTGLNPKLHCEEPASSRLRYGMTKL
jgi:hypothetical protein